MGLAGSHKLVFKVNKIEIFLSTSGIYFRWFKQKMKWVIVQDLGY
jgi:hypothetical protein